MRRWRIALFAGIGVATVALLLLSLVVGPGNVTLSTAVAVLGHRVTGDTPAGMSDAVVALVWDLRLPRSLLAMTVGAALATGGTVTQGLFRNPMAEPGVLGVSAGAAMTAVLGFLLGLDALGGWVTPLMAGLGAALSLSALWVLAARTHGMTTLLLAGIAVGALFSAVTTLMLAIGTERWDLGLKVIRWLMGSFEARSWHHLAWALGPAVVGMAIAMLLTLDLDALALGAATAQSLGVDLPRTRALCLLCVAILVGAATATTGVIGFVGLVVPHLARLLVGPGHARLTPTAAAIGALTLLTVDIGTRSATGFAIPPGVVTALVGAPVFVSMLVAQERSA